MVGHSTCVITAIFVIYSGWELITVAVDDTSQNSWKTIREEEQRKLEQQQHSTLRAPASARHTPAGNEVMFAIGDGDDDEGPTPRTANIRRHGNASENEGLMAAGDDDDYDRSVAKKA